MLDINLATLAAERRALAPAAGGGAAGGGRLDVSAVRLPARRDRPAGAVRRGFPAGDGGDGFHLHQFRVWHRCGSHFYCVPNEDTAAVMRRAGVPAEKLRVLGFPVDPRYAAEGLPPRPDPAGPEGRRVVYMINAGRKGRAGDRAAVAGAGGHRADRDGGPRPGDAAHGRAPDPRASADGCGPPS